MVATHGGSCGEPPQRRRRRGGARAEREQELPRRQARRTGGRHRRREGPQGVQGSAAAGGARQGREAPAGGRAHRPGPAGDQAAARDRQIRRHLAQRLHRARRFLERLPLLLGTRSPDVLGLHGRQGPAEHRQGPGDAGRRPRVARAPAPRDEVERRQAVHVGRLRVLVRGHLPEQGPRPHAVGADGHQRQAGRDREGRHEYRAVQVPRAVLHAPRRPRARPTACARPPPAPRRCGPGPGSCNRPGGPGLRLPRHGGLRARALPQAVPPEVRGPGRGRKEGEGREVRQLGAHVPHQERLGAQPGPAGSVTVEDGEPDQHADVDAGAQPLQRLRRHRGQSAPVHRQGRADAGGESRGPQPARHRGGVRLPAAAHRSRQAARAHREPAAGRVQGLPRSGRLRR